MIEHISQEEMLNNLLDVIFINKDKIEGFTFEPKRDFFGQLTNSILTINIKEELDD